MVSTPNPPRYLTVNISPIVPATWQNAMADAINAWNNLNLNVRFVAQNSTQNIPGAINVSTVYWFTYQSSQTIAGATLSTGNGNPGNSLVINTFHNAISHNSKVFALAHELGHSIGMKHTNGNQGTWVTNVSYNCKYGTDPFSIMQPYSAQYCWSGFSPCDIEVFNVIY
ncbi:MAG: hypothetical protein IPM82_20660 [Saprospiraceae bacterium]|nr:hypothetical protein [Saprospiraceae bacterium]